MNIVDIQWHPYRVPFVHGFTTAHGVMTVREGAIVEVTTDQGITGIGEIAPLPEFGGGSLAEACGLLLKMAAYIRGKTVYEALGMVTVTEQSPSPSVLCGLEIALLDALGKSKGCSISTLLSPNNIAPRFRVAVNAVIGARVIEEAVGAAQVARNNSFLCVKL